MKKFLFLAAAASMVLAACNKTEVVYTDGPQEIAMFAVNNVATKDAVTDEKFPETDNMEVAAYIVSGTAGNYFGKTKFTKGDTYWTGGQYWPVSNATINFLAVSEPATASPITSIDFNTTDYAAGATVVLGDNSDSQYDLMYAAGQGTKTGNNAGDVDMSFRHALSYICFTVAKDANTTKTVTVKSITLEDAYYGGTYTITNNSYNTADSYVTADAKVSGTWSSSTNQTDKTITETIYCSTSETPYGNGILVVPGATTSFTITYTIGDSGDLTHTATITKPADNWEQAYKYIYKINFGLNEIEIDPVVNIWDEGEGETISIN